ncbi:ANKRD17 [Symbiodinium pilosum]|uniref:ANKRD17 protein n=1 Tax=Symbiodinium pilosum TaxID=2952 RepID=A0A812N536_SYMPI|nr:ANKRD17 [Symbiodinium pilosum]
MTARLLLEARADVDKEGFDIDGCTPLVAAAHRDHDAIVELLIAARADVDKQPDWYNSALSYASRGGSDGMLRMLLEAGADPEREDCKSLVMRGEYEEAMRLLKEAAAEEKARMAA